MGRPPSSGELGYNFGVNFMATAAATIGGGTFRQFRRRRDLDVRPQLYEGRRMWGLKDPLALRYFQLNDEEFWIFEQLNGRASLAEIQAEFERRFTPRRLDLETLRGFIRQLHHEGLVLADLPEQGAALGERRRKSRRAARLSGWMNLLTVRFRGVDPEPALQRLYPWVRPLFSRTAAAIAGALIVAAVLLTSTHWREFVARLPTHEVLMRPSNIAWFFAALVGIKLLHELGHALACKHFGGECHETGLMLFCGLPSLYCNVSDAWMFGDKWSRIAVSAAGIVVELVLAAACTFLWWFTEPGLLHTLCLVVMCVCTVNTLLLNGNPLLRYDGYYMLADYIEIPNLSREASDVWRRFWAWLGGNDAAAALRSTHDAGNSPARTATFAAYGAASTVYSWIVLCGALWLLNTWAEPFGLRFAARVVTIAALAAAAVGPAMIVAQGLRSTGQHRPRRRLRLTIAAIVATSLAAAAALVPLPRTIEVAAVLRPAEAANVFVTQAGYLQMIVAPQTVVRRGEIVAVLHNDEVDQAVTRAQAEYDRLSSDLQLLERLQSAPGAKHVDLATARQAVAEAKQLLEQTVESRRRLTLTAPAAGIVVPSRREPDDRTAAEQGAAKWTGSPFDPVNRGAYLELGTPICLIAGEERRAEVVAVVAEADALGVFASRRAEVLVDAAIGATMSGTVLETAEAAVEALPPSLIAERMEAEPAVKRAANQATRRVVRIALDEPYAAATFDQLVRVKIRVADETLWAKVRRTAGEVFRL